MTDSTPLPTTERLLELSWAMADQPILMLVDMVADRFLSGSPKRISREAPVLILSYEDETLTPGGGANAVANVAALGGQPLPVGFVGDDESGRRLTEVLEGSDLALIECSLPPGMDMPSHLNGAQIADIVCQLGDAAPRRVVLTHLYPPALEQREAIRRAFPEKFRDRIQFAEDGAVVPV